MDTQDSFILLTRNDPSRNIARFYRLAVEPTLFGGFVLHRAWGRLGTWGQSRLDFCEDAESAHARMARLTEMKLKRGYSLR